MASRRQFAWTLAVVGLCVAAVRGEASDNSRQLDIPAFKAYFPGGSSPTGAPLNINFVKNAPAGALPGTPIAPAHVKPISNRVPKQIHGQVASVPSVGSKAGKQFGPIGNQGLFGGPVPGVPIGPGAGGHIGGGPIGGGAIGGGPFGGGPIGGGPFGGGPIGGVPIGAGPLTSGPIASGGIPLGTKGFKGHSFGAPPVPVGGHGGLGVDPLGLDDPLLHGLKSPIGGPIDGPLNGPIGNGLPPVGPVGHGGILPGGPGFKASNRFKGGLNTGPFNSPFAQGGFPPINTGPNYFGGPFGGPVNPIVPEPVSGYGPPIHPVPIVPEPVKTYGPPIHPVPIVPEPVKSYGPPIHPVPIVPPIDHIKPAYGLPPVAPPIVPPIDHIKPTYGLPPVPPPIIPVKPPKKTYGLPALLSSLEKKPLKAAALGIGPAPGPLGGLADPALIGIGVGSPPLGGPALTPGSVLPDGPGLGGPGFGGPGLGGPGFGGPGLGGPGLGGPGLGQPIFTGADPLIGPGLNVPPVVSDIPVPGNPLLNGPLIGNGAVGPGLDVATPFIDPGGEIAPLDIALPHSQGGFSDDVGFVSPFSYFRNHQPLSSEFDEQFHSHAGRTISAKFHEYMIDHSGFPGVVLGKNLEGEAVEGKDTTGDKTRPNRQTPKDKLKTNLRPPVSGRTLPPTTPAPPRTPPTTTTVATTTERATTVEKILAKINRKPFIQNYQLPTIEFD